MSDAERSDNYLLGLRGLLMSSVLFIHIFFAATARPGPSPWYHWPAFWFQPVMYAVGQFVMLSGYCLMLPLVQTEGELAGGIRPYLKKRFMRIVPPYYVALALSLAHVLLFPKQYAAVGIPVNVLHAGVLWSHLFLFYNFRRDWCYQINPPYWSLAPEWQLYIVFPILLLPLWRKWRVPGLLAAGLLGTFTLMLAGSSVLRMHPWFLFLFVAGMAGAVVARSPDAAYERIRNRFPWRRAAHVLFFAFGLEWIALARFRPLLLSSLPPAWQLYVVNEVMLGLATLALIVDWSGVQQLKPRSQWPFALRFLSHAWMTRLGKFSYSNYLVHFPILIAIAAIIRTLNLPEAATIGLGYAISVPISLGLGYLFYAAVERRFLPSYRRRPRAAVIHSPASHQQPG